MNVKLSFLNKDQNLAYNEMTHLPIVTSLCDLKQCLTATLKMNESSLVYRTTPLDGLHIIAL